jgi:hypothetical protein
LNKIEGISEPIVEMLFHEIEKRISVMEKPNEEESTQSPKIEEVKEDIEDELEEAINMSLEVQETKEEPKKTIEKKKRKRHNRRNTPKLVSELEAKAKPLPEKMKLQRMKKLEEKKLFLMIQQIH